MIDRYKGKQVLWLLSLSLPPAAAGFTVHTTAAFLWGLSGFILFGLIGPFIYYLAERKSLGDRKGPYHGAAHLASWSMISVFLIMAVWYFLDTLQKLWEKGVIFICGVIPVLAAIVILTMVLDDALAKAYAHLKRKNGDIARWLASCFLIGAVPAAIIFAVLFIYFFGEIRIDPYAGLLFVSTVLEKTFLLKIFLAMAVFAIYLYFALDGSKGRRATQVVFTSLFYLMMIYIPIIVSLRLPHEGAWRAYADPAYISLFPVFSDLWSVGASIFFGGHTAKWIFK